MKNTWALLIEFHHQYRYVLENYSHAAGMGILGRVVLAYDRARFRVSLNWKGTRDGI